MSQCWRPSSTRLSELGRAAQQWALAALAALWLIALAAAPAAADGLIVRARPGDGRGLQVDAAVLLPRPIPRALPASDGPLYVVRPGDTLSAIAARAGLDMAALMALNGLRDPDRLTAGQTLKLGAALEDQPAVQLPTDGVLTAVQLWPWPPRQGQTLTIWLQARRPVAFKVQLGETVHRVVAQGRRGWALIPIPPLAQVGPAHLTISAGEQQLALPVAIRAGAFPQVNIPAAVADPILAEAARVQDELARFTALWSEVSAEGWTARSRFRLPLAGDFPRTSPYGSRRTYGSSPAISAHAGEDFSAGPGTPVYAPADGAVVLAELTFVRGNAVLIDHGQGVFTGYWHLSRLDVQVGQRVTAGQLLGAVGSTGLSTGAHLHWELRIAGMAVDPLQWVESGE